MAGSSKSMRTAMDSTDNEKCERKLDLPKVLVRPSANTAQVWFSIEFKGGAALLATSGQVKGVALGQVVVGRKWWHIVAWRKDLEIQNKVI